MQGDLCCCIPRPDARNTAIPARKKADRIEAPCRVLSRQGRLRFVDGERWMNTHEEELPTPRRRPWLRRKPRPIRQTMVIDRAPEVQIGIFEDAIYLTRRQGRGWVTYPISPEDLASALSKLPTSSGLLPPNTLGTGTVNGQRFYRCSLSGAKTQVVYAWDEALRFSGLSFRRRGVRVIERVGKRYMT